MKDTAEALSNYILFKLEHQVFSAATLFIGPFLNKTILKLFFFFSRTTFHPSPILLVVLTFLNLTSRKYSTPLPHVILSMFLVENEFLYFCEVLHFDIRPQELNPK